MRHVAASSSSFAPFTITPSPLVPGFSDASHVSHRAQSKMKVSGSSLLKSLTNKIHPPLPINPRESQKLLALLNSSFRQQLNKEHPQDPAQISSPANTHLRNVLSSPLFGGSPNVENSKPQLKSKPITFVSEIQDSLVAPIEHFQEQVAAGQATIDIATRCLKVQRQNKLRHHDAIPSATSVGETSVAGPILHWLWASGLEESLEFVHHPRLLRELVPVMVLEHKDRYIWKWLNRMSALLAESRRSSDPLMTSFDCLLFCFQRKLIRVRGSTRDAVRAVTLAIQNFKCSLSTDREKAFGLSVFDLVEQMLSNKAGNIDGALYDEFEHALKRADLLNPLLGAKLALCHPIKPNPLPALEVIRQPEAISRPLIVSNKRFVVFCTKTAEVLKDDRRELEAQEVMDLIPNIARLDNQVNSSQRLPRHRNNASNEKPDYLPALFAT